ncbi:protein TsetseEP [Drosophila erecta]|uniref:GG12014 n=1 Tax=Drosophila erecta TaxID=7220 RepID=B3P5G5_DROER|nr:protein TsetseEP [Drosophila erecta]EDV53215.1 uncharacterized protein Dere_GG12014 [Drosophila erecta]
MFSKLSLLAVVLAFGLVSGLSLGLMIKPSKLQLPTNKKILGLQQQTEELAARDPGTSIACFDYYIPLINGLSAQYEFDYNKCVKDYDYASQLIIDAWNSTLFGIQASGDSSCKSFFDCSCIVDSVLAFECFAKVGAEQSKIMYQVSANATEAAVQIKIHLQTVETKRESCFNYAERDFVEGTSLYYGELNKCLAGAPIPQDTTENWFYTT